MNYSEDCNLKKTRETRFLRFRDGQFEENSEVLVQESSLELWFEDVHLNTFSCSPGDREHLVHCYLLTTGLISSPKDVQVKLVEGNRIEISASSKNDFVMRFLNFIDSL